MAIRPIDVQVNVTGSNQVSEIRQKQQQMEQIHQQNPQGATSQAERKLTQSVNEVSPDVNVDPDGKQKQEAEQKEHPAKDASSGEAVDQEKPAKPVSDGIRGKRLDFTV